MSFGENLARRRREAGYTQQELAAALGVSFQAVSCWEHDKYLPDISRIPEIAALLSTVPGRLLGDDGAEALTRRDRFSDEGHMHTFIKLSGRTERMPFLRSLLREAEAAYAGKTVPGTDVPFRNLPLSLCCHTLALGLCEDDALGALFCLAPEKALPARLPENVKAAVTLFSAAQRDGIPAHEKELSASPSASLLVCLYHAHAPTAGVLTKAETLALLKNTDENVLPLIRAVKSGTPEQNNAAWTLSFALMSSVELARRFL